MLAQNPFHGENAATAVLACARTPADLGERTRTVVDGGGDVAVAHDSAVAHDHVGKASLSLQGCESRIPKLERLQL